MLEFMASREDMNRFCGGNPLPGAKKELRVRYLVVVRAVVSESISPYISLLFPFPICRAHRNTLRLCQTNRIVLK